MRWEGHVERVGVKKTHTEYLCGELKARCNSAVLEDEGRIILNGSKNRNL
jgi:hypothetical protein